MMDREKYVIIFNYFNRFYFDMFSFHFSSTFLTELGTAYYTHIP